jgi:hypothetical protein
MNKEFNIVFSSNNNNKVEYRFNHLGFIDYGDVEPLSLQVKKYWNGKIIIGRSVENFMGMPLVFINLQRSSDFSRRHTEISLKVLKEHHYFSKRFLNFLMCVQISNSPLNNDNLLKIIYSFYKKPRNFVLSSGKVLSPYFMVRDLGSTKGTNVKILQSELKSNSMYLLSEELLIIEEVANEGLEYQDGYYFRGIPSDCIEKIAPDYAGNVIEDRKKNEIVGRCGFPYVLCMFKGDRYFLIATKRKKSFLIGRDEDCDIVLDRNNFSRTQSVIEYDKERFRWTISDGDINAGRRSTNGTYKVLKAEKGYSDWEVAEMNEISINELKIRIEF